jgi:hypothetical protein
MSSEPSDFAADRPPDPLDFGGGPPANAAAARARVQLPAIFLIILGALNLLGAAGCALIGVQLGRIPPAEFEKMMQERDPARWQQVQQGGWTTEQVLQLYFNGGVGTAVANLLSGLLMIWGGARMMQLRSYSLAVFASVLAALPCISASGCCGLGAIVGLWAVIVLASPAVREAFR